MSNDPRGPDSNDTTGEGDAESDGDDTAGRLLAGRCDCGHVTYPSHPVCPACGEPQEGQVELSERKGTVLTWTTATTTPPGVREPNTLAIVVFEVDGQQVRALGGTTDAVEIGDRVRPVHVEQLRDPEACVRAAESQRFDGVRFEPVE
ncbi:MAG: putative nucleic-acid-binding protein containing a Zn-ribbon [halophilic archaeon J07HX64]|jgi:Predicted nucleic-acid-binding protein containing a Zn-ribbon|nr:MAG: putative nucleic-acid-binding protein containing a Zn-ribbon [halophilic archaeon J07HX64]